jgi:BA14K-like protein
MRHAIDTAPRDGKVIILQDDATGTYDVAHWSPFGEWVGENGEPSKITPTRWYPMPRDEYLLQEDKESSNPSQVGRARRRFAASSITAALVAAALVGMYFRTEVAAYVTRYAGLHDIFRGSTIGEQVVAQETQLPSQGLEETYLLALRLQAEGDQTRAQMGAQEAAQLKQAVETSAPESRQSFDKEPRPEVLANEVAEARPTIDELNLQLRTEAARTAQLLGLEREKTAALVQEATAARQELTASMVQHRHALEEERARGAALASGLANARREVETQVALLRKAGDEAVDVKQKPAAGEEMPGVSLPPWANSDALVKPAQTAKQPDVTPENSKPAIKPVETVPLPREHAMSSDNGYSCQRYRTYDPASGTYRGYDGRRHSCP